MFKQNLFVSRVQGSKIKEIFEKDTWMEEVLNVLYKKKPVNLKRVEEGDYDDCCLELIK